MEIFTFFWSNSSPFSQWHRASFKIDNIAFVCAEQYMMYQKAKLFGDTDTAEKILKTTNPAKHKLFGRQVKGFDSNIWAKHREKIVYEGNYAKFTQNTELKQRLLATAGTTLVEASPYDEVWGIGLAESDPRAKSRETWQGSNLLGQILTKLRDDLLQQTSN